MSFEDTSPHSGDRNAIGTTSLPNSAAVAARGVFVRVNNISAELRRAFGLPCPVSARKLVELGANDELPLSQQGAARLWGAWSRDLPEIARRLGMVPPAGSAAPTEQPAARTAA